MKFEVWAGTQVIGWSALDMLDPPMGCACGVFHPNKNFENVRINLAEAIIKVQTAQGEFLEPQGRTHIEDHGEIMGPDRLVVNVLGIDHAAYRRVFPAGDAYWTETKYRQLQRQPWPPFRKARMYVRYVLNDLLGKR